VQMALMAVGLIMYVNLPSGYLGFTTPVALSLAITSAPVTLGGPLVSLPMILVYYLILAKAAVDQSAVFAEAQAATSRLAESEMAASHAEGQKAALKGMVINEYDWIEAPEACPICHEIAANGPYPIDTGPMPVRDSHPGCFCVIAGRV